VRKPHIKNNVVTIASGTVYDADGSDADVVVEVLGATIAMARCPPVIRD